MSLSEKMGPWRRLLVNILSIAALVFAVVLLAVSVVEIMSYVDSLLASQLGLAHDDACNLNAILSDYRPIAFHQVGSSGQYLYCGWNTLNTGFRCLVCSGALLAGGFLLLVMLKLKDARFMYGGSGLSALLALLLFVVIIIDANSLRTAGDNEICRRGSLSISTTTTASPTGTPVKYECDMGRYYAVAVMDVFLFLVFAGLTVHTFLYVRSGKFAEEVGGGEKVDYYGEVERYFPDDNAGDDDSKSLAGN